MRRTKRDDEVNPISKLEKACDVFEKTYVRQYVGVAYVCFLVDRSSICEPNRSSPPCSSLLAIIEPTDYHSS
jgi:hypothetical protein